MSGNTLGRLFTVTTFGESHGPAMGAVADGCLPGLALEKSDLQRDVDRRRSGTSKHTSQRCEYSPEPSKATPPARRSTTSVRVRDHETLRDCFRPGRADDTYQQ
jgi:chorismate synthase